MRGEGGKGRKSSVVSLQSAVCGPRSAACPEEPATRDQRSSAQGIELGAWSKELGIRNTGLTANSQQPKIILNAKC